MYSNNIVSLTGMSKKSIISGSWIEYHGFQLARHSCGEATVIKYKSANASIKYIAVKDAKFRNTCAFGTYGKDIPELGNFGTVGKNGGWDPASTSSYLTSPFTSPMKTEWTNDAIYNGWATTLLSDKSAKENCDIWMKYKSTTDTKGTVGVPAVAHARSQTIDGIACDIATEYQIICIWVCSDKLDEMDVTASEHPQLKLGCTSTGYPSRGRYQNGSGGQSAILWSSTECHLNDVRAMGCTGYCSSGNKSGSIGTAVPVLEIEIPES